MSLRNEPPPMVNGRGENVVGFREILNTKIKLFFSQCLFCILISLSQNPI